MEELKKKTNWIQLISFIVIALLGAEDVMLIYQNRQLKDMLKGPPQMEPLKAGEHLETVKVQTLDGTTTDLAYTEPSQKYLLFVFSTTCPHCEKTLPAWQTIANNKNDNCNILGISIHTLEETNKFVAAKNINFVTVTAAEDTSFSRKYKVAGVPETILISGNGTVEKAWVGELNADQTKEIQNLISSSTASTN